MTLVFRPPTPPLPPHRPGLSRRHFAQLDAGLGPQYLGGVGGDKPVGMMEERNFGRCGSPTDGRREAERRRSPGWLRKGSYLPIFIFRFYLGKEKGELVSRRA